MLFGAIFKELNPKKVHIRKLKKRTTIHSKNAQYVLKKIKKCIILEKRVKLTKKGYMPRLSVTYTEDNFREKHLAEMDVNLVLDKEKTETIDEWQEVHAIWDAVRFKCDQDNEKGKYIL